jgi:hypothetical protein
MKDLNLRNVTVMRYILPLREGGSLPALAEADDDFKYVLKFRGAGHGVKMLISELLGGKIAEILGLKIPELVFANLDIDFGRTEADEEIQDLLKFSEGLNLGLHYLSGAIAYDPSMKIDTLLASKIVAYSVISYAFAPTGRRHDIDSHRAIGYGKKPERYPVPGTNNGE